MVRELTARMFGRGGEFFPTGHEITVVGHAPQSHVQVAYDFELYPDYRLSMGSIGIRIAGLSQVLVT